MTQFESEQAVADLCKAENKELVIYKGKVYDVQKFAISHPGGKKIILKDVGKSIDQPFDDEGHSSTAQSYFGTERVPCVGHVLSEDNQAKLTIEIDTEYKHSFFCSRKYVVKKLFTNEDPIMLHKTLGLLCLMSFIYRYLYVFPMTGNLGFEGTGFDFFTIALHMALSSSSMIFHVLPKRIVKRPLIIWNEYRLHTICFTARCTVVAVIAWIYPFGRFQAEVDYIFLYFLVMFHHVLADEVTRRYGEVGATTVRGKVTKEKGEEKFSNHYTTPKWVTLAYAFFQFIGVATALIPNARMMEFGFNSLAGIQSSAFLMTLFRKGLIRWYSHAFWYLFALAVSGAYVVVTKDLLFWAKLVFVFNLRVNYRMSKYLVWAIFTLISLPVVHDLLST